MSSLCPGCFSTGRTLRNEYESTVVKARQYSEENKLSIAIYKDVEGYNFISADIAINNGYPIREIINFIEL